METRQKYKKKPHAYEIYQKYYPNASKGTPGSKASANLREFKKNINDYCERKGI
jgi:hypothetical protein